MSKEKIQGDKLFGILIQINDHNKMYGTTYNLAELDRKEFDEFQ